MIVIVLYALAHQAALECQSNVGDYFIVFVVVLVFAVVVVFVSAGVEFEKTGIIAWVWLGSRQIIGKQGGCKLRCNIVRVLLIGSSS